MFKASVFGLMSILATIATLLAAHPHAFADDLPAEHPLIGLNRGDAFQVNADFTLPPALAFTSVAYQEGTYRSYFDPSRMNEGARFANGGINADAPVCELIIAKTQRKFSVIKKGTRLIITRIKESFVEFRVSGNPVLSAVRCHAPGFVNNELLNITDFKTAFGGKIDVITPPFDVLAPTVTPSFYF